MNGLPNAVIVGVGVAHQRIDDPDRSLDAAGLMARAVQAAAADAGTRWLIPGAQVVLYPQGTWSYGDPTPLVIPSKRSIHSIVGEIGVLQHSLLRMACDLVNSGEANVVIVCGGETKYRSLQGLINSQHVPEREGEGEPTERLSPGAEIITQVEIQRGLAVPARQYALIDSALAHSQGLTREQHRRLLADQGEAFSVVAATNPDAWIRRAVSSDVIEHPIGRNSMVAFPYTKLHCSQWNVDQAAALIVCSDMYAAEQGIARDRWVYAHAMVESNHMVPLTNRAEMHRSPAMGIAAAAINEHLPTTLAEADLLDLYSCFPAAVRVQQAEFGLPTTGPAPTVTGGMAFAGGPLNNYTLQATVRMVQDLRRQPSAVGVVTNVSGMLTKFGMAAWSAQSPTSPMLSADVSTTVGQATATVEVDPDFSGAAQVIAATVGYSKGEADIAIIVGRTPNGLHCVASTSEPSLVNNLVQHDWMGQSVSVSGAVISSPPL